ncbi:hypothetical protein E0K93_09500 [Puniceibacterium sp. HSS470]|nr:hypothetical protein E0K93_09500 [Puniceibacterium sp. HSS470]|tara:strand:- start:18479 stop:18736 length:258 start_codon:yes stop_codon:yes gene_type:complete
MSTLAELVAGLGALIALLFAGKLWISGKTNAAKDEARSAIAHQANTDTIETRKRIDNATRDVPEPDDARERLQRFGKGAATPPER